MRETCDLLCCRKMRRFLLLIPVSAVSFSELPKLPVCTRTLGATLEARARARDDDACRRSSSSSSSRRRCCSAAARTARRDVNGCGHKNAQQFQIFSERNSKYLNVGVARSRALRCPHDA